MRYSMYFVLNYFRIFFVEDDGDNENSVRDGRDLRSD